MLGLLNLTRPKKDIFKLLQGIRIRSVNNFSCKSLGYALKKTKHEISATKENYSPDIKYSHLFYYTWKDKRNVLQLHGYKNNFPSKLLLIYKKIFMRTINTSEGCSLFSRNQIVLITLKLDVFIQTTIFSSVH